MIDTVDRILDQRLHQDTRRAAVRALAVAALLHLVALAVAWLLPRLFQEPLRRPEFVAIRVVPAARLGSPTAPPERPRPQPRKQAPTPSEPKPATEPEPRPEPVVPAPSPSPRPTAVKPAPAAPEPAPPATQGRRGSPQGDPAGTSAFGARIAGVDDLTFTYDSYLDRMLSMIEAAWRRPPVEGPVETTIYFRVARDGSVSELHVVQPSGLTAFDLAAVRAVQNAAPLPPLPRSYRESSLGVNLIVR